MSKVLICIFSVLITLFAVTSEAKADSYQVTFSGFDENVVGYNFSCMVTPSYTWYANHLPPKAELVIMFYGSYYPDENSTDMIDGYWVILEGGDEKWVWRKIGEFYVFQWSSEPNDTGLGQCQVTGPYAE